MPAPAASATPMKRLTLLACILGSSIVFIDGTVVQVALPAIRDDLDAGLATQQWVIEAYLLTLSSLLLIGGSLGDLFGRRKVFALGVAGFGATSLMCALAPNSELLVAGRALQGMAGALLVPSSLAIIMSTFDEGERGGAIGAWTAWSGAAGVIGPLTGGVIVEAISWRCIFAINVPLTLVTLLLIARAVPESRDEEASPHLDLLGAVLCALGLAGVVVALINQPTHGWADPLVAPPLALGAACLVLFLVQERRARQPMLPLSIFARRNFAVGNLATLLVYAGLGASSFLLVLFLQQVAGYNALQAGLAFLPATAIMFLLSRRFGALADRFGPQLFMGLGPVVGAAGLALQVGIDRDAEYLSTVFPGIAVFGLGLALTVAPLTATVLEDTDQHHAGLASGVNNAIARVAGLIAIAAVGALAASQYARGLDERLEGRALGAEARATVQEARERSLSGGRVVPDIGEERAVVARALDGASERGYRVGMAVSAALVLAGGLVSLAGIRNPRREVDAAACPGGPLVGAPHDETLHSPTARGGAAPREAEPAPT